MAFDAPRAATDYPPALFCLKYGKTLAPHGHLLSPQQVFKNKNLGEAAEKNIRKAFKITFKKLSKMRETCAECGKKAEGAVYCPSCLVARYCSESCRLQRQERHQVVCHEHQQEAVDQFLECLPCPLFLGRETMRGRGGAVWGWPHWLDTHTTLREGIRGAVESLQQWWGYTGTKNPGSSALQYSLERHVSNIFSTALTISHSLLWMRHPSLFTEAPTTTAETATVSPAVLSLLLVVNSIAKELKDVHIHLLGADRPEVTMVESGLVQVCCRVLQGSNVHLTLVAPDLMRHPQTLEMSPTAPRKLSSQLSVCCYPGLYHTYWEEHVDTSTASMRVPKPDVAVGIHPGLHTPEMWVLWRPTVELLVQKRVPLLLTTYNVAEYEATLKVLSSVGPHIVLKGLNPLGSLQCKQTPYEPDHVWAANSYAIGIGKATPTPTPSV